MKYGNKNIQSVKYGNKEVVKVMYGGKLVWEKVASPEIPEIPNIPEDFVDLGLPSGTLWCTHNVGASLPEEYGNYYAWGEVETKDNYAESNSITYGKTVEELQSLGIIDENLNLTPTYDAATVNLGDNYAMPTENHWQELIDNCTWQWETVNGVRGAWIIGPNSNHIFLPAAGWNEGTSPESVGLVCYYWETSPNESYNRFAFCFRSFVAENNSIANFDRYRGLPVRPVYNSN